MEGDTQSGLGDHRQVVGTVTHGDGLRQVHLLHLCDELQQLSLAVAVHYFTHVAPRQLAVLANLQFIGVYVVDAVAALQVLTEVGESTREDGYLVATALQDGHQPVRPLGDGQVLGYILHHAHVKALQQGHPPGEALLEVYLSTHGTLGDGPYLGTHTVALGQLVDALRLYQCGVHIEADQSAHTAEHIVTLEREVYLHLLRQLHQLHLHLLAVSGLAAQRELYAGTGVLGWVLDALAPCQSQDAVYVQSLVGQYARGTLYLACLQLPAQHHQYIAILALVAHPVFVLIVTDGSEADVHAQFGGLEEQFFHHLSRVHLIHADEDAQRER